MTEQRCTLCGIIYTPENEDDRFCQCCKDDMDDSNPYGFGTERGYEAL